jgi:hypothetical protein
MNVNGVSNSLDPYLQSLLNGAGSVNGTSTNTSTAAASLSIPQEGNPQLSPFAQLMSTLQQLQQSDPAKYQQVTSQIATNLQTAAKTATADGNTSQAAELNQLATDFTNASQNNTLPNVQDLAQALNGGHGHHHHHHMQTSSASSDQTSSANNLSQQISAFLVNSTSSTQAASLNPLSIIQNTLSSAGVSLS